MTLDELRAEVDAGRVDTVLLCLTDMQGRVQGKRMHARFFLDEVSPLLDGERVRWVGGVRAMPKSNANGVSKPSSVGFSELPR